MKAGKIPYTLNQNDRPEDKNAKEEIESDECFRALKNYDQQLEDLMEKIWQAKYLSI